jgi:hypothetical protein
MGSFRTTSQAFALATNAFTAWHRLAEDGFFDFMMSIV